MEEDIEKMHGEIAMNNKNIILKLSQLIVILLDEKINDKTAPSKDLLDAIKVLDEISRI